MAQGGRGWFHRKRHQPEPEPTQTFGHETAEQLESTGDRPLEPSEAEQAEWSPEVRERPDPAVSTEDTASAPGAARPAEGTPTSNVLTSGASVGLEPDQPAGGQVPTDLPPAGDSPTEHKTEQITLGGRATAVAVDWDAATAAALSDEPESDTPSAQRPPLPASSADRLLEDIIREIVGDAAVDTASALQPARQVQSDVSDGARGGQPPMPTTPAPLTSEPTPAVTATDPDGTEIETADALGASNSATSQVAFSSTTPTADGIEDDEIRRGSEHTPAEAAAIHTEAPRSAIAEPTSREPLESLSPTVADRGGDSSVEETRTESTSAGIVPPAVAARPFDAPLPAADEPEPAQARSLPRVSRETIEGHTDAPVSRETGTEYGGTPLADQLADETRRRIALEEAVLPLPASTRVLTISNQKGGVGKTTTAVNLAAALARSGAHVLVIDLDPQGNASTALGVDHRSEQQSVYDVLVSDLSLAEVIRSSTEHEKLDCVPATIHLAGAEIELVSLVAREQRLRRALDRHLDGMARPYDYVLIDCPPSLGLLTINAFVAAREVLIPIQCEYYALEGLSQLLSNIELIEKHLNPELRLSTILLTMYDSRTNLAQQVAQEVREHFPAQTLDTIIPRSVRVSEAPSYGQSVISYDYGSSGSLSYREAAAEIAWRGTTDEKESN